MINNVTIMGRLTQQTDFGDFEGFIGDGNLPF